MDTEDISERRSEPIAREISWTTPPEPVLLTGTEPITGTSTHLQDFWSWAMSDLRANTTRSLLAEYLVATALGAERRPRVEWDSCDIALPEGRVEVKASAYLQAWAQREPSKIVFRGIRARAWSPENGHSPYSTYNADVYVFALMGATEHDRYDALDTSSWRFWVIGVNQLQPSNQSSISFGRVQQLAGEPVTYHDLGRTVRAHFAIEDG